VHYIYTVHEREREKDRLYTHIHNRPSKIGFPLLLGTGSIVLADSWGYEDAFTTGAANYYYTAKREKKTNEMKKKLYIYLSILHEEKADRLK